ncbi:hypothetical protein [Pseudorhodobacter sp.]|uniref:hypothetical protein n=1 Tax=Pseudorhodobacter sp. TaxID=1934400 RepID=UPI002647D977|nr:hypothetical protein [Pseudorhodobacter sp.]MDN5789077.1 hypothetical protein [Pseudorhodobacter sp.]
MNSLWLLRMQRWLRHPPSAARVKLVFGVILACLLLVGYEHFFGWPEWLTLNGGGRGHRLPRL